MVTETFLDISLGGIVALCDKSQRTFFINWFSFVYCYPSEKRVPSFWQSTQHPKQCLAHKKMTVKNPRISIFKYPGIYFLCATLQQKTDFLILFTQVCIILCLFCYQESQKICKKWWKSDYMFLTDHCTTIQQKLFYDKSKIYLI